MHCFLLFIDGFGLGEEDASFNPIFAASMPNYRHICKNGMTIFADAALGIPGLPQSATGQTALFTGINAAAAVGRHIHGFPTKTLRGILAEHSVFLKLTQLGYTVTNANMYTQSYVDQIHNPIRERTIKISATTAATMAARIPFRTELDLLKRAAVYQDITNESLIERGYAVPWQDPYQAGTYLAVLVRLHHFTLFEYFQTDLAGHSQDMARCIKVLETLDQLLGGFLSAADMDNTLLIISSDHGNIEDLRVKMHTQNKVPIVLYGKDSQPMALNMYSIMDIAPGIHTYFKQSKR